MITQVPQSCGVCVSIHQQGFPGRAHSSSIRKLFYRRNGFTAEDKGHFIHGFSQKLSGKPFG